jgi:hypothetical protein
MLHSQRSADFCTTFVAYMKKSEVEYLRRDWAVDWDKEWALEKGKVGLLTVVVVVVVVTVVTGVQVSLLLCCSTQNNKGELTILNKRGKFADFVAMYLSPTGTAIIYCDIWSAGFLKAELEDANLVVSIYIYMI